MNAERLMELWEEHRAITDERVAVLALAVEALADGGLDDELHGQALTAAHQLGGSLGMFGYVRAGALARAFETRLLAPETLDEATTTLAQVVADIRAEIGVPLPATEPAPDDARSPFTLVLLVLSDGRALQRIRTEAGRRGLRCVATTDLAEVGEVVAGRRPEAVVLDLACAGDGLAVLQDLRRDAPDVPALVLADDDAFATRLAATRAGAAAFLDRTAGPAEVVDQVALALRPADGSVARGLVVSARPAVAEPARDALAAAGLEVETTAGTSALWDELRRVNPSLIVVDAELEDVAGADLVRVLRADRNWMHVPVLAVVGADAGDAGEHALAAGADDVLTTPFDPATLASRVRGHLDRSRLQRRLAGTDLVTGLEDRHASAAAFGRLLRLAERMDRPLCLAVVELDRSADAHGHLAGDGVRRRLGRLLRQYFRAEDVVAHWGDGRYVVGLLGVQRSLGIDRLQRLLASFREEPFPAGDGSTFTTPFSAAVAQYPIDGTDLEELHVATNEALDGLRHAGAVEVVAAGHWRGGTEQVEVAIVEDDEVTAAAIARGLTDLGHRCWRFSNGASAVAALAGRPAQVRARLILLDLDLPAVDGFELLAHLGREGVLQTSTVIVVSVTADAETVARTRALGAADHLAKPVELDVLAGRVDRVLGRSESVLSVAR